MSVPDKYDIDKLFNEIYDSSFLAVMKYVSSKTGCAEDACDIVQETYLELYRVLSKRDSYIKDYTAFAMHIAKKKLFRHYSLAEKFKSLIPLYRSREEEDDPIEEIGSFEFEDELIDNLLLDEIWKYIMDFEEETKQIFILKYRCGKELEEISRELNIPLHSVRNRLYRSMVKLKENFSKGKGAEK